MKFLLRGCITFILMIQGLFAQTTFPSNYIPTDPQTYHAYIHANIQVSYKQLLTDATLLILGNKVVAVGPGVVLPKNCVIDDLKGAWIYPSFIDAFSNYEITAPQKRNKKNDAPQFLSEKPGAYSWNEAIHPEINASDWFQVDTTKAEMLRAMGFGLSVSQLQDGLMRGTTTLIACGNERENTLLMKPIVSQAWSFLKGSSIQDYPSSMMGSIALLRQTMYDAKWYQSGGFKQETNLSLQALNQNTLLPIIFEATDVYDILRVKKIADEFKLTMLIKGNGAEYQIADDIKKADACVIIPLNFPLPYDVDNAMDASYIPLVNLKHWELAPFNARILYEKKVPFVLTSSGCKNEKEFWDNLRKAVKMGLPEEQALKSLLYEPAMRLNITNLAGSLQKDMPANFFISSKSIFSAGAKIISHTIQGRSYRVQKTLNDIKPGEYRLIVNKMAPFDLRIYYQGGSCYGDLIFLKEKIPVTISYNKPNITLSYSLDKDSKEPTNILIGYVENDTMKGFPGSGYGADYMWRATLIKEDIQEDTTINSELPPIPSLLHPFQSFGFDTVPKPHPVLFKNVTVWTNEKDGILRNTDVLISNGKISSIGKNLTASDALIIDGTGKHLTSGIIDEHSHIAIYKGVNEGTQSVTSEVRIGDVLVPNDIHIYWQLAGGVTTSHLLHGSANVIGGQTQLIKLRWGLSAEQMKFAGWPGFIKFALGENVKQSNWGDNNRFRFPQTRMGVEQTLMDAFNRAKIYQEQWAEYNKLDAKIKSGSVPPRRDLELDALVEVLNKQRFITCHSYVQSEINMLMHVADTFGFTLNTFTHILEGYKVADKLKKHGAGASTFSDWWAYKYEVVDAIPYNGALLSKMGIITAFNSDDAEMARRLNQEAAKAVMYGGLSEEDAWKLVTLNPAKLLHIDSFTGSIKPGKDADIVLWSGNPLSMYSRCEQTYVDGICYFSLEENEKKENYILNEKSRILNLMAEAKHSGAQTQMINLEINSPYHCDTEGDFVK